MFLPGSRYEKVGTYPVTASGGSVVTVTRLPLPSLPGSVSLRGWHRRQEGQRLDHIANHFLADPTAFWRLCDANHAVVPDALAARPVIAIPHSAT